MTANTEIYADLIFIVFQPWADLPHPHFIIWGMTAPEVAKYTLQSISI